MNNRSKIRFLILSSLLGLVVSQLSINADSLYQADGEIPKPVQIVESQTKILLEELSNRKQEFDKDPQTLIYFARHVALSHWDLAKTSRLMLGKFWKQAKLEQQERFQEEFLRTLLRYVVKAYGYYDDSLVEIVSYDWQPSKKGGWVRSVVQLPAKLNVSVDYRMLQSKQEEWKLVDVRIEGISLVNSKRNEYRRIVSQKGMEALINRMFEKNQKVLDLVDNKIASVE
ncbi:MAG: ABC transporter substrate-binding protein [Gammaproteobacteria bacterium]|nr:ABC transporter substrate-binding protein [Gammaproteobacteria bacterium]